MNLRDKISQYFGLRIGTMHWSHYFATLNTSGKITARTLLDLMIIILEQFDEMQNTVPTTPEPHITPEEVTLPEELEVKNNNEVKEMITNASTFTPTPEVKQEVVVPVVLTEATPAEKIDKIMEQVVDKTLPEAILGNRPPTPVV